MRFPAKQPGSEIDPARGFARQLRAAQPAVPFAAAVPGRVHAIGEGVEMPERRVGLQAHRIEALARVVIHGLRVVCVVTVVDAVAEQELRADRNRLTAEGDLERGIGAVRVLQIQGIEGELRVVAGAWRPRRRECWCGSAAVGVAPAGPERESDRFQRESTPFDTPAEARAGLHPGTILRGIKRVRLPDQIMRNARDRLERGRRGLLRNGSNPGQAERGGNEDLAR